MNTFFIITNFQKDPDGDTAVSIRTYLESKGKTCYLLGKPGVDSMRKNTDYHYTDSTCIPEDVECVLVIGGDGTLLQAARDVVERQLPLLGINMGTLGFLAEIESGKIFEAVDLLIEDQYQIEERMMLQGRASHHGKQILEDMALNDIVLSRIGHLRILNFNIYVNGEFLRSYSADGVIVSTPTGSTAYNLSVGGPIVAPEASLLLLTAIAPHSLISRPIVFPADALITIEIASGHGSDPIGAEVTFDGDTSVKLQTGDKIDIFCAKARTRLIRTRKTSFLEALREKMNR